MNHIYDLPLLNPAFNDIYMTYSYMTLPLMTHIYMTYPFVTYVYMTYSNMTQPLMNYVYMTYRYMTQPLMTHIYMTYFYMTQPLMTHLYMTYLAWSRTPWPTVLYSTLIWPLFIWPILPWPTNLCIFFIKLCKKIFLNSFFNFSSEKCLICQKYWEEMIFDIWFLHNPFFKEFKSNIDLSFHPIPWCPSAWIQWWGSSSKALGRVDSQLSYHYSQVHSDPEW